MLPQNYNTYANLNNGLNINNLPFQKDNKINSDTSSLSINSDKREIKPHKLFNSINCGYSRKNRLDHKFSIEKRIRFIKNGKIVYVRPGSAAAKRMEKVHSFKIIFTFCRKLRRN